jgi:hypothetical protein
MSNHDTSFNKSSNGRPEDIEKAVNRIFEKDNRKTEYQILEELKQKYRDNEIVDAIMKRYGEKLKRVKKLAEKIKERLYTKHPNLTTKEKIDKIIQYKQKFNFDDSELEVIKNLVILNVGILGKSPEPSLSVTEMSKALGFMPASYHMTGKLQVKKEEQEEFEAIRAIAAGTKELHQQVTLQSIVYNGETDLPYNTTFERTKINLFSFVHPVVAALFLPKFQILDSHMLLASIAQIIEQKHLGFELKTQPEYELYWDIATDPAEVACSNKTKPFTDLLNRCNVQVKLWESVLNLRQGKFYMNDLSSFILAIDKCKASVFDAADLAYIKDEGTILRKLFAAFSLRPTIVATMPSVIGLNQETSNIASLSSQQITTLHMLTVRIPMNIHNEPVRTVNLKSSLTQQRQLYIHHRQISVRTQNVLYSREILVFYVSRRYHGFNLDKLSRPYEIASLPVTMSVFERLQSQGVEFPMDFQHDKQNFALTSLVAVDTAKTYINGNVDTDNNQIIIGCSAYIRHKPAQNGVYCYKPMDINGENAPINDRITPGNDRITPISYLNEYQKSGNDPTLDEIGKEAGTLFIYKSTSNTGL